MAVRIIITGYIATIWKAFFGDETGRSSLLIPEIISAISFLHHHLRMPYTLLISPSSFLLAQLIYVSFHHHVQQEMIPLPDFLFI
jgi:hypothetical protein